MSLLELGGKYREMYTGFENIEVPCMVILMLSRNRFFTGNYHVMHVMESCSVLTNKFFKVTNRPCIVIYSCSVGKIFVSILFQPLIAEGRIQVCTHGKHYRISLLPNIEFSICTFTSLMYGQMKSTVWCMFLHHENEETNMAIDTHSYLVVVYRLL